MAFVVVDFDIAIGFNSKEVEIDADHIVTLPSVATSLDLPILADAHPRARTEQL